MPVLKFALWERLSRRTRRWVLWLAGAFIAYSLIGFLVVPAVVKWQVVKQLPAATKRQAAVRQVKFNPWALSLTVRGLELTEPDGRRFAGWEEFYVNFQASSLFRWQWTFHDIRLVDLFAEVVLFPDGRLNFANMFEADPAAPPPRPPPSDSTAKAGPPRIGIHHLAITNGFVAFEDQTLRKPFRTEYRPINLELKRFTTRPETDTPYAFEAEGDSGRRVAWSGDLTVEPLRSAGRLELTGGDLSRFQPYLEDFTRAQLTNGLVDLALSYRFAATSEGTDLVVTNLALHGKTISLFDPDHNETVVSLGGFEVADGALNLRERTVRLGSVRVSEGTVVARRDKDGQLNLLSLLEAPPARTNLAPTPTPVTPAPQPGSTNAPPAPWTIELAEFGLERTRVSFEDLALRSPFKTELAPIEIGLTNLSTAPNRDATYGLRIATEATETLAGGGTASINPVRSTGTLTLSAVELPKYLPYLADSFRGQITAGKLDLTVPYRVGLDANALVAGISNLNLRVNALEVKAPAGDETVAQIKELAVEGVAADLADQRARVGLVKSSGGSFLVRRLKDGSLNLLDLVAGAPPEAAASPPPEASGTAETPQSASGERDDAQRTRASSGSTDAGWAVALDELDLADYTFRIEDQQPATPAEFLVDQFALNVRGYTTEGNPPLATRLGLRFEESGTLATEGTLSLTPPSADLGVALTNLDLTAFQPYLEQVVRLNLTRGALGTTNHVRFDPASASGPHLTFAGNLWLTNVATTDQVLSKDLVKWDALTVSGIALELEPNRLKLDEVRWQGLEANLVIGPDGQANVASLMASTPGSETSATTTAPTDSAPAPTPAPSAPAEPFPIELGALVLENVGFAFTDQSLQPAASLTIGELSGSIRGLSSALNTTAEVELEGKVDKQAPFGIKGRANPLAAERLVDLEITNRSTQLSAFTPYTEKYLGYPLNRGRLTMGLKYLIQGTQLEAQNRFEIDQLTLGPRNTSPDATSLPVKLGVALLKDRNGRIELDVPITGRLDDPDFRLGGAIAKVIANLIIKAAASPFSLLGKLVGGGEELSFIEFEPGTTNLVEGELPKLEKLAKALTERPALNLEIEGLADPARDRDALARARLREQLRSRYVSSLRPKERAALADAATPLEPEVYADLLRAAVVETFGTNLTAILATNPVQAAATNLTAVAPGTTEPRERKRRRGFLGLGALFGGGTGVKPSAAEKQLGKAEREVLDELTPEVMEQLLVARTDVSEDELRELMNRRAQWVQERLLETGAVTADRLLLLAPKAPPTSGGEGLSRVNLALN